MEEGFARFKGGLRAVRVPFESFAGEIAATDGERQSLLKLVLSAVTATRDYSIFGSEALQILVEYKWEGFARRMFVKEFVLFGVHLVITTVYTIQASAVHVRLPSTSK